MNHGWGNTVLVIDDDPDMLELIDLILSDLEARVYTAAGGAEGLRQFYVHRPDLIILDLMMPDMDGWEVCRSIRHVSDVPVIIVTAVCQDQAEIKGLECGADEYITKPFKPAILLARVRATLRRAALPPTIVRPAIYSDGYLTIDLDGRRVLANNRQLKLSATEYQLLAYLYKHADRVLTSQQILRYVWGDEFRNHSEYVRVYISRLRQKLEKDPQAPRYLHNEPGFGYRFEKQLPT